VFKRRIIKAKIDYILERYFNDLKIEMFLASLYEASHKL